MVGSIVLVPIIGLIIVVGVLLAAVVGVLLHRVLRGRPSFTGTAAAVAGGAAGLAVFVVWCVFAAAVLFLLANIAVSRM